MAETLVIVESPSKAKTIEKYLGSKYRVIASNGHVRDLPKSQLGVDVEHDFEPKYITLRGRGEVIEKIRKEAKHAKHIVLATDPDREGEAISWHLAKMLKLDENEPCRVVFNEITKAVIQKAVKIRAALTETLLMRSRRGACLTVCSATKSARCFGQRFEEDFRRAVCSRLRQNSSATESARYLISCRKSIGRSQ